MAIAAEPQPFLVCPTKGTSIQRLGGRAARRRVTAAATSSASPRMRRGITSANRHDNENDDANRDKDEEQVAVADIACREIALGLFGTSRELGEVFIVELLNRGFDLLWIRVRGLEGLLGVIRGQEVVQLLDVLLPCGRSTGGIPLDFRRRNHMILSSCRGSPYSNQCTHARKCHGAR